MKNNFSPTLRIKLNSFTKREHSRSLLDGTNKTLKFIYVVCLSKGSHSFSLIEIILEKGNRQRREKNCNQSSLYILYRSAEQYELPCSEIFSIFLSLRFYIQTYQTLSIFNNFSDFFLSMDDLIY